MQKQTLVLFIRQKLFIANKHLGVFMDKYSTLLRYPPWKHDYAKVLCNICSIVYPLLWLMVYYKENKTAG